MTKNLKLPSLTKEEKDILSEVLKTIYENAESFHSKWISEIINPLTLDADNFKENTLKVLIRFERIKNNLITCRDTILEEWNFISEKLKFKLLRHPFIEQSFWFIDQSIKSMRYFIQYLNDAMQEIKKESDLNGKDLKNLRLKYVDSFTHITKDLSRSIEEISDALELNIY